MSRRRTAMTLIEVLVAVSLGVLLVAITARGLLQVQRSRDRGYELVAMHRQAAAIHDSLAQPLRTTQHSCQWSCEATGIAVPGSGSLTLTWMAASPEREADVGAYGRLQHLDLVWWRLRWTGQGVDAAGRPLGSLQLASSSGWRTPDIVSANPSYRFAPQPRRDRRRDLDDNDLRFEPGITPGQRTTILNGMPIGDGADLDRRLLPLHPPSFTVEAIDLAWVDRSGAVIAARSDSGMSARDAGGSVLSVPGSPLWFTLSGGSQRVVLDGAWLDGRSWVLAPDTRTATAQRPSLLRVRLVLRSLARPEADTDPLRQEFRFSLPTAPDTPAIP